MCILTKQQSQLTAYCVALTRFIKSQLMGIEQNQITYFVTFYQVHDYLEVVEEPMDLEKIRENIDRMEYETIK